MPIEFTSSPRSTLGIEWELTLVDRDTRDLVSHAPQILMELDKSWPTDSFPHFASELLQNTIEIVSSPHSQVSAALQELREMARAVSTLAEQNNARVIGSGTHPFSRWDGQNITDSPRYENFIEHTRWWGRNMLIWGVHTHLGVDRKDRVVPPDARAPRASPAHAGARIVESILGR
ncbi:MAG: carboxylate-amine ligase [Leucobacter sp.]